MIKRVRDVFRGLKPIGNISYEEWQAVCDRATSASRFCDDKNEIYTLLKDELKKAEDIILENKIHEVHDIKKISNVFRKVFIFTKKEQVDELVGQIKLIRRLLEEAKSWIETKENMEKMEADGKIIIDRGSLRNGRKI
jgi:transcriptional accessory protein Tex/SPT6